MRVLPLFLIILLVCGAGCVEEASISTPEQDQGVNVTLSGVEGDWSFAFGCHWRVTGVVVNAGMQDVSDVTVVLSLINKRTNIIEDSRTIAAGALSIGESRAFSIYLDGECGEEYRVQSVVIRD